MKVKFPILVIAVLAAVPGTALGQEGTGSLELWVHPGTEVMRDNGYSGPQTCVMCHPNALDEITHSVHWYAAAPVRNVKGLPDGTWWGMVNRECALAGTTALSNWTASTKGRFTTQSAGCGMCHIGALPSPPLPPGREATEAEANTVDCLVCHAGSYDMRVRRTLVTDAGGRTHWGQDTSLAAALSITRVPTAEACLRCHEHSFSLDYKRGTPYTPTNDVHAAAGLPCTACHLTTKHKMAKGQAESDMVANDLPDVSVACANCHGRSPHRGAAGGFLNAHVTRISCQMCHVPSVSGIVSEDWGKPVKDDGAGAYSELSRYDGIPSVPGIWVPTVVIRKGAPDAMWRVPNTAGQADAQSWMAFATASRTTDGAKLYPVRALAQILLFDKTLKMWQAPGMEFIRAEAAMAGFPLLLAPNREVYNDTGDVKAAIDAGMRPYGPMGLKWSGGWMAMKVPGTSYISVNHGVKRMGFGCQDCHSPHGVLDLAALGFTPDEITRLEKPR